MLLDTPERILRQAHAIRLHTVTTRDMPPNNITGMTFAERHTLAVWLTGK